MINFKEERKRVIRTAKAHQKWMDIQALIAATVLVTVWIFGWYTK